MGKKEKQYLIGKNEEKRVYKNWQSSLNDNLEENDSYIVITRSLLESKKWIQLSNNAKVVYLSIQSKCGKDPNSQDKDSCQYARELLLQDTNISSPNALKKAINLLIDNGFIDIREKYDKKGNLIIASHSRIANCYKLSDRWYKNEIQHLDDSNQ